mgnify:CR=1 FL=1
MIAKRIFDLVFVVPGIIVLLPLLAVIAVLVRLDSPGPAFFRQVRVGRFGREFRIFKFRTMSVGSDGDGPKVTVGSDARITAVGRVLRKYKLDELPQLFNVLKGEMSLVGPRPEVPDYVKYYPDDCRDKVLSVPPGLTDYAAIEFRNESEILDAAQDPVLAYVQDVLPQKLSFYEKYIDERSLLLDIRLILRTFVVIVRH